MKCATEVCDGEALFTVFWPGQTRPMCVLCTLRAQNIAAHMGFVVDARPIYEPPQVTPIVNVNDVLKE